MAEIFNLLVYLGPFLAWGLIVWFAVEALWAAYKFIWGLESFCGLHRDQFTHLLPQPRDSNGNPIPEAPPSAGF